ncbi:hypothetical protein [Pantoea dispersa]|uniref:Uncharacterized protein n=1 Tax=Pantoea dispersa TaxID=59814 RepID=A0A8E1S2I2_9GAMM|nr:hypothetical protein [Pantoea dispersa]KTR91410.1 hypothetical protein SA2_06395 [Pantoea dispersa]KTS23911.1 hypothetical protein SA4R_03175 [Pantoea dispersa]KTS56548.1 hypothetical protein SA5R_19380 [Pantoea dispersa]KTS69500.1 hypothetical protein SA3R_02425 [Pantoea dispersa]
MPDLYYIPGFEPDDIRDIAKSALRQVRERQATIYAENNREVLGAIYSHPIAGVVEPDVMYGYIDKINLCEKTTRCGVLTGYANHLPPSFCTAGILPHYNINAVHKFDCQLDSADHGDNVVFGSDMHVKKTAQ